MNRQAERGSSFAVERTTLVPVGIPLGRSNSPAALRPLATASGGRVVTDLGWKDTVMIWPGETVRIAVDFRQAFPGAQLFLFHCHNLEHEDGNMMVNYRIPA